MTDLAVAWDAYSHSKPTRRSVNAAGSVTWFNWTQYPDHGPGAELLSPLPGRRILELGCGKGGNLAHLATLGVHVTGIDLSPAQLAAARERWGQMPDVEMRQAEAVQFLRCGRACFDAVYSVFGAVWFTDPRVSLPAIRDRLTPGGRLVFSHRPPVEGRYGCQPGQIQRGDGRAPFTIRRWDFAPAAWLELLGEYGFTGARARVLPAPHGRRSAGTLLVEARSAGCDADRVTG